MRRIGTALLALLLLSGAARAQEMPYPDGLPPEDLEDPGVGVSLTGGVINPAAPAFQSTTRLSAAALNAALGSPTIIGGSINGVPIGAGTAHTGRFTNLTVIGEMATTGSNAWAVGDGTTRKTFTHSSYLSPSGGVMTPLFLLQGNAFGTITSNANVANLRAFNVNSDTVNANGAQGGGLNHNYFGATVSPGSVGGRTTLNVFLNHAGSTQGGNRFHVALAGYAHASGSAGGTAGVGNSRGNLFGFNTSSLLATTAGQYWEQVVGTEVNVGAQAGTSVNDKVGLQIVQWKTDAVAANRTEAGLLFVTQPSTTVAGWDKAVQIGAYHGSWPVRATGSLFALGEANPEFVHTPMVARAGIDFASIPAKFTTAAFASPGFLVNGSGQMTLGSNTIGWSSTGLAIGAAGKVGAISSIAAGGAGHVAGAILRDTSGGVYEIATVSGGAVTGLTVIKAPTITSGSAPSNPLALAGGKGTGATVNLAWADAQVVAVGGRLRQSSAALAAVGTTQSGAAQITTSFVRASTASGQTAFVLPPAVAGDLIRFFLPLGAAGSARLYPAPGESIYSANDGTLATNVHFTVIAGTEAVARSMENGKWIVTTWDFGFP